MSHLQHPLLTSHLNAPAGANLMWNPLMPLAGVVVSPVTAFAGPVVGFNLIATLGLALCGLAATASAARFVSFAGSAIVAGIAYEISPFAIVQSQAHQAVVLGAVLAPLVLLLLHDILISKRRSVRAGGLLLGLAAAATFYTWEESLAATALAGMVGVIAAAVNQPRASWLLARRALPCLGLAAAVALVIAAPGLLLQFFGPQRLMANVRQDDRYVTDLVSLIIPTHNQLLAPGGAVTTSHAWTGNGSEWDGYLGLPLLVVAVAAMLLLPRRAEVRWLATCLFLGITLTFGPSLHVAGHDTGIPLPWALLRRFPLLDNLLAARFAWLPALAAALLLALAVDAALLHRRRMLAVLTLAAVAVTLLPRPLPASPVSTPSFFTEGDVKRIPEGSVALVAPFARAQAGAPLVWQAEADMRFRMPEGYVLLPGPGGSVVSSPPETNVSRVMEAVAVGERPVLDSEARRAFTMDLHRLQVQTVIVGDMPHSAEMISLFTELLGRPPARTGGVAVWWNVPE